MILRFYDPFLRSEFVLHFTCCVKIMILTTLVITIMIVIVVAMIIIMIMRIIIIIIIIVIIYFLTLDLWRIEFHHLFMYNFSHLTTQIMSLKSIFGSMSSFIFFLSVFFTDFIVQYWFFKIKNCYLGFLLTY